MCGLVSSVDQAPVISLILLFMDKVDPEYRAKAGITELTDDHLWAATMTILLLVLAFRMEKAFSRFWEGTGLLHQMRGEWFDTVSNLVSFTLHTLPKRPAEVMRFRHAIIRLMSLCHGSALEEIADNSFSLESIDTHGLDDATLRVLVECHTQYNFNKVEVMLHLLQSIITDALNSGIINVAPPICSRVYQTISRGFVNLLNAKKIQDTKFPFPYVQLLALLMLLATVLTPLTITAIVQVKVFAALFSFVPAWGLYCLLIVSQELENPFGTDDNDLPLRRFQDEMNCCLMMLLHPKLDLVVGVSPACEKLFSNLYDVFTQHRQHEGEEEEEYFKSKPYRLSHYGSNGRSSAMWPFASTEAQDSLGAPLSATAASPVSAPSIPSASPAQVSLAPATSEAKACGEGGGGQTDPAAGAAVALKLNGLQGSEGVELLLHLAKNITSLTASLNVWSQHVERQIARNGRA
eukprot:TRINITY_DN9627_c0_g1_i2.p1 TRINITY_DN9627_c0_g1~~TRINITY_DN9627_c0_g1_i2.p1  ORF type:complete len:464 (-),score=70.82 TRINITY_DN9627_c0_g1_i2:22-1413(-)